MKLIATMTAASLVLVTASVGAQNTATKPYPPGFLKNLAQQMVSQGQTMRAGPVPSTGNTANITNVGPGFYQVHPTNCVALGEDPTTVFGCIFSQENIFFCSLNPGPAVSAPEAAACANGNLVGLNVIDQAGTVNEIISYPVK